MYSHIFLQTTFHSLTINVCGWIFVFDLEVLDAVFLLPTFHNQRFQQSRLLEEVIFVHASSSEQVLWLEALLLSLILDIFGNI